MTKHFTKIMDEGKLVLFSEQPDSNNTSLQAPVVFCCRSTDGHFLMIQRSAWTDQAGGSLKHETSACCVHCRLRLYPWLWYFSLSVTLAWPTPPPLSSLTPHQSRAEFTFFTNPLSSATKTLSSPDQNRPVDTSSRVPRRSLSSTNWLTERRKMSYGETRKRATSRYSFILEG